MHVRSQPTRSGKDRYMMHLGKKSFQLPIRYIAASLSQVAKDGNHKPSSSHWMVQKDIVTVVQENVQINYSYFAKY